MKIIAIVLSYVLVVTSGADSGISKKNKAISKHLPLFRHETFFDTMDTLRSNRHTHMRDHQFQDRDLKRKKGSKGNKGGKCQARLEEVEEELDVCKAEADKPHWLIVQMADQCTLYRDDDGVYHLESSKFRQDTEWFTDRPYALEDTTPTSNWFKNFDKVFADGKGMPNAAVTIVDDDESKDVVVSAFAKAYIKESLFDEGEPTYGYVLKQFESQENVLALETLMGGEDSVVFDHCSMFIDDVTCWIGALTLIGCYVFDYSICKDLLGLDRNDPRTCEDSVWDVLGAL